MAQTVFKMMCQSLWLLLTPFPSASLKAAGFPSYVSPLEMGEELDIHFSQSSEASLVIFRCCGGGDHPPWEPHSHVSSHVWSVGRVLEERSTEFCFDLPQNARLSSAGAWPTTILSLGAVFSVLSNLCKCWSGFLCSLLDLEAGVFCSGNQVFKVRLELILCK